MKKLAIYSLLLLFTGFDSFPQSNVTGNFTFGGFNRSYRLYIPASYSGNVAVPLVINMHGYGSNAFEQEIYSNFKSIADTANFIIVHPNGTLDGIGNQYWNTFGGSNVDDVGFITALIDTIKNNYFIDDNCIYSTGMSNGGFMSYKLACNVNYISAIASVTGTMTWNEFNSCVISHPTPVMQIHGTADGTVPYNGSLFFVPVDSIVKKFVKQNNCDTLPVFSVLPDIDVTDNSTAEHYIFGNGDNGSAVELYKIIGGGHSWPGAPVNIDVTNHDFNASATIWKFFRKYKLNTLTHNEELNIHQPNSVNVFPNPSSGHIRIRFAENLMSRIVITDIMGNEVFNYHCYNCETVETHVAKKGLFIVNIESAKKSVISKLVIY